MTNEQTKALAVECTKLARSLTKDDPSFADTEWAFEFSPETFSDSSNSPQGETRSEELLVDFTSCL
jgi:hypothetical protein